MAHDGYAQRVAALRAAYDALPADAPVRLGKRTSNLFRTRAPHRGPRLDVRDFAGVLSVDPVARTADVLGMTTYEQLVDALLPHGLVPLVVPELKTITLGGAVAGTGVEATSFRNGLPHESVLEMDVLTGDGRVVTCSPTSAPDLFSGFPNSYGTLGYALRLRIELEPVLPYVHLRHLRCGSVEQAVEVLREAVEQRAADFVEGVWSGPDDVVVTLASYTDEAPALSDYTGTQVYYRSLHRRHEDWLTVRDHLWRWDTDWFWCSRALGVQDPRVRRWVPRRYLRSDTWWRIVQLEKRYRLKTRWDLSRGRPPRDDVVQDVQVPLDRLPELMAVLAREVPITPVWLCPLRQRDPSAVWELYRLDPDVLYVNVGVWGSVALEPGEPVGTHDRLLQRAVDELGGRTSLYSTSWWSPEELALRYGGPAYELLKKTYDPDGRLLDLHAKCVQGR